MLHQHFPRARNTLPLFIIQTAKPSGESYSMYIVNWTVQCGCFFSDGPVVLLWQFVLCCSDSYIHRHTGLTRTYSGVIVSCKDTAGELNCDGCVCVCVCRRCDMCVCVWCTCIRYVVCVCAVFCVHKVGEIDKYCEFQLRMHRATINMCVLGCFPHSLPPRVGRSFCMM